MTHKFQVTTVENDSIHVDLESAELDNEEEIIQQLEGMLVEMMIPISQDLRDVLDQENNTFPNKSD